MAETLDISQFGAELRGQPERVESAAGDAAFRAAMRSMPRVVKDTPSDTGRARAGWDVRRAEGGADLYNDAPHIGILEAGSRPHWPPLEPILRWVVRVFGIDAEDNATSRRSYEDAEDVSDEAYGIAFAVQAKIARDGTEPHWMVRDNLPRMRKLLKEELEGRLDDGA